MKQQIIIPDDLAHVIETMRAWLDGEPVWSYAKILETWGPEFEMYRRRWDRQFQEKMKQAEATGAITFESDDMLRTVVRGVSILHLRDAWIAEFGFAIPCAELLDELAKHRQIVEVGAGTGYMTRLMLNRDINVIGSNPPLNDYTFELGKYAVLALRQAKTMARANPDATVFCSWPTLRHTWFRQMLRAMKIGQHLIVIREDACAEATAWQYLDDCFEELSTIVIPTFEHMNDYASVHVKKRNRSR
jgi:hypothetical protein